MAADAFSLRCSPKAQVNLAFDLRSSYTEPWVSNPSYQTNKKYPRQAQVFSLAGEEGFEPSISCSRGRRLTAWPLPIIILIAPYPP